MNNGCTFASLERLMNEPASDYVKTDVVPFFKGESITVWRRKDALIARINFHLVSESNSLRERVNKSVH